MLRKNRAQSSSLFLMELILAILFFSITSAVCVQFFVKSHLLSQESQVLTQAVNECSTIAEILRTSDSLFSAEQLIAQEYPDHYGETDSGEPVLYFDEDFAECSASEHIYKIVLSLDETDDMLTADMNVIKSSDSSVIYQLQTQHHIARRTAHEER